MRTVLITQLVHPTTQIPSRHRTPSLSLPAPEQSSIPQSYITPNPTLSHFSQSLLEGSQINIYMSSNNNTATVPTLTTQHRPILDVADDSTNHEDTLAPESVLPLQYEVQRTPIACHSSSRAENMVCEVDACPDDERSTLNDICRSRTCNPTVERPIVSKLSLQSSGNEESSGVSKTGINSFQRTNSTTSQCSAAWAETRAYQTTVFDEDSVLR